jgi:hypothetical protein
MQIFIHLTLTFDVATISLRSAHVLILVINCAKTFFFKFQRLKCWSGHEM